MKVTHLKFPVIATHQVSQVEAAARQWLDKVLINGEHSLEVPDTQSAEDCVKGQPAKFVVRTPAKYEIWRKGK